MAPGGSVDRHTGPMPDPTTAPVGSSTPADELPADPLRAVAGDDEHERRAALRRARLRATGLVVLAAAIFVVARIARGPGWLGYVEAAAEAAVIGGLADWFAVTALFRHPLGLPIPHTAILPTRKAALGASLAEFVETNFLDDTVIAERLAERDVVGTIGSWMSDPDDARRLVDGAARTLADVTSTLDADLLGPEIADLVEQRLRRVPVATIAARAIETSLVEGRVERLVDRALSFGVRFLQRNRHIFRHRLGQESPRWVPAFVDERVYNRIEGGLARFAAEIADEPDHPFRAELADRLAALVEELDHGGPAARQLEALWNEALDLPEVTGWIASLWSSGRDELSAALRDPDSDIRRRAVVQVIELGGRLVIDAELRERVQSGLARIVDRGLAVARAELGDLIVTTVERWDAADASDRIELAVGRDLQFIRINGTLVGAVLGLVIHGLGELLL